MAWPQSYKTFFSSAQLRHKFILLINVKMPTIVGILTFMSRIYRLDILTADPVAEWLRALIFHYCT